MGLPQRRSANHIVELLPGDHDIVRRSCLIPRTHEARPGDSIPPPPRHSREARAGRETEVAVDARSERYRVADCELDRRERFRCQREFRATRSDRVPTITRRSQIPRQARNTGGNARCASEIPQPPHFDSAVGVSAGPANELNKFKIPYDPHVLIACQL
jgi:hypothetical protein